MNSQITECFEVIATLNQELYEKLKEQYEEKFVNEHFLWFMFEGNDMVQAINYGDDNLWCSESDDREFDLEKEEFEDLLTFCRNEFNAQIEYHQKLKL